MRSQPGFMSKATSVPQANHSQNSSPVEALNLIVESNSLPAEVIDLNIELHLPVEVKEKLAITLLILWIYLLLTEFEVRTVSYGPSFFPFDL